VIVIIVVISTIELIRWLMYSFAKKYLGRFGPEKINKRPVAASVGLALKLYTAGKQEHRGLQWYYILEGKSAS
jgi:hypothetical protein